jgi:hypothetical protein
VDNSWGMTGRPTPRRYASLVGLEASFAANGAPVRRYSFAAGPIRRCWSGDGTDEGQSRRP